MNPLYNTNDSPNASTQPTKSVNLQGVSNRPTHNTFDMSYHVFTTQHYGTLEPFFVMEGVAGDKIPLSSSHDVRTFPMSSPFLSKLKLSKDYFMVPMQAILPNTWEYIFKNPSQGDDVDIQMYPNSPVETLGPVVFQKSVQAASKLSDAIKAGEEPSVYWYFGVLASLFSTELLMSSGSLLCKLGYNMQFAVKNFKTKKQLTIDEYLNQLFNMIDNIEFALSIDGVEYRYIQRGLQDSELDNVRVFEVTKNQALTILRNYLPYATYCKFDFPTDFTNTYSEFLLGGGSTVPINLSRVFAYQLACYQYYVNPQVDFIYNAQIYRDNFFTLLKKWDTSIRVDTFLYNGTQIPYDFLSYHYLNELYKVSNMSITTYFSKAIDHFSCLNYLFGLNSALKFGDYFTDSRTRPYAPGDMTSPVTDSHVSAIDVTKSIVMQRFLNSVVRLGNNFGDYLRGIFGTTPSPDYHYPKFISHQDFDISGFEVANTTETGQGSLVTNLKSSEDKYAFEVEVDMPCVLIGISYFTMPQVYCQATDKHFFHADRFDFFNPMLQYIGDQAVEVKELSTFYPHVDEAFGYQSRYNEYKQRFSIANGGFVGNLPAWAYVSDKPVGTLRNILPAVKQSPDFIRCVSSDFDRFLPGLSGFSLAQNFHFIVVYNNKVVCNRPIEVNPNIL